jgi:hypothetical protein
MQIHKDYEEYGGSIRFLNPLPQGIFARTWESRIDLLRVVIIGSQETPYEHAPFVIGFYFDDHFPTPPQLHISIPGLIAWGG